MSLVVVNPFLRPFFTKIRPLQRHITDRLHDQELVPFLKHKSGTNVAPGGLHDANSLAGWPLELLEMLVRPYEDV